MFSRFFGKQKITRLDFLWLVTVSVHRFKVSISCFPAAAEILPDLKWWPDGPQHAEKLAASRMPATPSVEPRFFLACLTLAAALDEFDISRHSLAVRGKKRLRPHSGLFYLLITLSGRTNT